MKKMGLYFFKKGLYGNFVTLPSILMISNLKLFDYSLTNLLTLASFGGTFAHKNVNTITS